MFFFFIKKNKKTKYQKNNNKLPHVAFVSWQHKHLCNMYLIFSERVSYFMVGGEWMMYNVITKSNV